MLENFNLLEKKYEVEKITVNGIQIWPVLRTYFASQVVFDQDRSVKLNKTILKGIFRFFFKGFYNIFKKTDYIFFTSSGQRRVNEGGFFDIADVVASKCANTLIVELPYNGAHLDKKMYLTNRLMSKYPFYFFTVFLSRIRSNYKIHSEQIIKDIMKETGIFIPYQKRIKIFMAERRIMKFIIKWKKLKGFFLITPYTNMGYVFAFKEKNLPVLEFQHGTISRSHYAYNIVKPFDNRLFPDYLLTFGKKEREVFTEDNFYIKRENVIPVGSMVIDTMMNKKPRDKKFEEIVSEYSRTVAFSAQDAFENQFTSFLKLAAEQDSSICYILMPRFKTPEYYLKYEFPDNVKLIPWLSTYELIYLCNIHSTINSTTAIEAPSLGTINILANIENRSKLYFENILDERICLYADTPEEYVQLIKNLELKNKDEIALMNEGLIESGFIENLPRVISRII